MPESSIEPSLVSRLLLDRDAEYRRANAAEQLVEELSDARVRIYPPAGTEAALPGAQNVGGDV